MPVLVRWDRSDGSVVLRAAEVAEAGSILPDHVIIHGVHGLEDDQHPDLELVSITIRREEIGYVAICKKSNKVDSEEATKAQPEEKPVVEPQQEAVAEEEVINGKRDATGNSRVRSARSFRRGRH